MGRIREYEGEGITVHFDGSRCIHAARCVKGLPAVFRTDQRPWIDATQAKPDEIAPVVHQCPSGALTYVRTDGGPAEPVPDGPVKVRVEPDGPLYLRGAMQVVGVDGEAVEVGPRVALCRCGASSNKPFCDNSHVDIGFSDA